MALEARLRVVENNKYNDLVLVRKYPDSTCKTPANAINKNIPARERSLVELADRNDNRYLGSIGAKNEVAAVNKTRPGKLEDIIGADNCKHQNARWHRVFSHYRLGSTAPLLYHLCCPTCLHPKLDVKFRHQLAGLPPLSDYSRSNYFKKWREMAIANNLPLVENMQQLEQMQPPETGHKLATKQDGYFWAE